MPHSQDTRHMRYETLYIMLLIFASGLFLAGALLDTPDNIARGLIRIVMTEDPLITDYVRLAGVGAALINSSVVTALSVLILRSSGEPANGFTLVVVGLMAGFSLFGKNPVNTWPIVLGIGCTPRAERSPLESMRPWPCCPRPWGRSSAISSWTTAGAPRCLGWRPA